MKKILTLMVCFFMLFLVSCDNSKNKNDIMQFSETTKATSKTELTEKISVTISTSENCDEHWNENFDSQEWPIKKSEGGCFCFSYDGNVIQ